jgi:hypothetical protein
MERRNSTSIHVSTEEQIMRALNAVFPVLESPILCAPGLCERQATYCNGLVGSKFLLHILNVRPGPVSAPYRTIWAAGFFVF